jgi:hypothetical protein
MRLSVTLIAGLVTAGLAIPVYATPASAQQHIVIRAPRTTVIARASAPGQEGGISNINGRTGTTPNDVQNGRNVVRSTSPISATPVYDLEAGVTVVSQFQGLAVSTDTNASSSLSTGNLRARVDNREVPGTVSFLPTVGGSTYGELQDTIYFTNTGLTSALLEVIFSYDGELAYGPGTPFGPHRAQATVAFDFGFGGRCGNGPSCGGDQIFVLGSPTTGSVALTADLPGQPNTNPIINNHNNPNLPSYISYTPHPRDNQNGFYGGVFRTTWVIPTGRTSIGYRSYLDLLCFGDRQCNFGSTASTRFGALPDGLTYSSASGVFLTGLSAGGVPEPATWAMMILGFGVIGGAMRRRREGGPALRRLATR